MTEHFKDLAQRAGEAFFASKAINYYGEVFTVDDGKTKFEIDITIRPVDNPSAHELRTKAEFKVEELTKEVKNLKNVIRMLQG